MGICEGEFIEIFKILLVMNRQYSGSFVILEIVVLEIAGLVLAEIGAIPPVSCVFYFFEDVELDVAVLAHKFVAVGFYLQSFQIGRTGHSFVLNECIKLIIVDLIPPHDGIFEVVMF